LHNFAHVGVFIVGVFRRSSQCGRRWWRHSIARRFAAFLRDRHLQQLPLLGNDEYRNSYEAQRYYLRKLRREIIVWIICLLCSCPFLSFSSLPSSSSSSLIFFPWALWLPLPLFLGWFSASPSRPVPLQGCHLCCGSWGSGAGQVARGGHAPHAGRCRRGDFTGTANPRCFFSHRVVYCVHAIKPKTARRAYKGCLNERTVEAWYKVEGKCTIPSAFDRLMPSSTSLLYNITTTNTTFNSLLLSFNHLFYEYSGPTQRRPRQLVCLGQSLKPHPVPTAVRRRQKTRSACAAVCSECHAVVCSGLSGAFCAAPCSSNKECTSWQRMSQNRLCADAPSPGVLCVHSYPHSCSSFGRGGLRASSF